VPALLAGALLSACAGTMPLQSSEHVTVSNTGVLPPPSREDLTTGLRPNIVGPGDHLAIDVFGLADLTRTVAIDTSGRISLPLAGEIQAAGKTPDELSAEIARRLSANHVRNPRVTVNIADAVSQIVAVDGDVTEPGLYPVVGDMTLMRAIARAKGATEFARLSHVVLFRTVNGQHMAALYDLRAIRAGAYPDPQVYANDVIVVGESQARRLFHDLIQGSALITTPIIALIQR
jgi:polysaccharide export outer membrane protein